MDKIISEEEKIRRAEEISARRQNRIPASSINNKTRTKMPLFNKLFLQIIVSICIFGIMYFLSQNNSYAIEKIKPVMSTDTDFGKIYYEFNNVVQNLIHNGGQNENNEDNKDKESTEENKSEENTEQLSNEITNGVGGGNEGTEVSQDVDDITYIKNHASFIKPLNGTITSPYGERTPTNIISANHQGVDIGADLGTDIVASMEGTVEYVSEYGDYGIHLKITNGEISTLYAHCSKIVVNEGEHISQGQKIAEVGETGKATGPHLHFEIRRNDVTVDPQLILEL